MKTGELRASKNLRVKKLMALCTKIAMFMVKETFADEETAQAELLAAIKKIEAAAELLLKSDEAHQTETPAREGTA